MKREKRTVYLMRKITLIICAAVVLCSGFCVIREWSETGRQRREQERLAELAARIPETEEETGIQEIQVETELEENTEQETEPPYLSPIDFEALSKENPDVVGWITIPDTRIDYPIVYTDDNETYLDVDFSGNESVYGAIYLDCDSEPDFRGWNHPVYGHHMRDGSMFKDLVKFKDEEFFRNHQFFEIYTPERTIHLKALSCYYTGSGGIVRKTRFSGQEEFDQWLKERLEPCRYAEIPERSVPSVFTLVTCSYEMEDARTVLFAVEVDEDGNMIAANEK